MANPGIYTLKASARVTDAIKAAGGMTEDADAKVLTAASLYPDEEVVYVATRMKTFLFLVNQELSRFLTR